MMMNKKSLVIKSIIFGLIILASINVGVAPKNIPESKIVTLADHGQTITLQVNETFLLNWEKGMIGTSQ